MHTPLGIGSAANQEAEAVNRWLLGAIADAWRHYPSAADLAPGVIGPDGDLAGRIVDRLVREGLLQLRGSELTLTGTGFAAVDHVHRSDARFAELLRTGALPGQSASSSLVLAILRTHFELNARTNRRESGAGAH